MIVYIRFSKNKFFIKRKKQISQKHSQKLISIVQYTLNIMIIRI